MSELPANNMREEMHELASRLKAGAKVPLGDSPDEDAAVMLAGNRENALREAWIRLAPSRFLTADLDDFEGMARDTAAEWVENPRGRNLILLGPVGTGKTHLALATCRRQIGVRECRFYPVGEMLDLLRPGGPERGLEALLWMDTLIIDDLGTEKATDWTAERLFIVINRRWMEERPVVATSNLPVPELKTALGERTFSRLVGNEAVVVTLSGKDRRA